MSDATSELFAAQAQVVRGGNRSLRLVAHVVCRDANGQIRWEDDAETTIVIPAGTEVPVFQVEGPVTSQIQIAAGAPLGPLAGGD